MVSPDKKVSSNWKMNSKYQQSSNRKTNRSPSDKSTNPEAQFIDSRSTVSEKSKAIFIQHLKTRMKGEEIFNAITHADM